MESQCGFGVHLSLCTASTTFGPFYNRIVFGQHLWVIFLNLFAKHDCLTRTPPQWCWQSGAEHVMQGPLQKLWVVVCIDLPSSVSTTWLLLSQLTDFKQENKGGTSSRWWKWFWVGDQLLAAKWALESGWYFRKVNLLKNINSKSS